MSTRRFHRLLALLALAPVAALAANYRMQQIVLEDIQAFDQPVPAVALLIPAGWSWQGAVTWGELPLGMDCLVNSVSLRLDAVSPDRRQALYLRPGLSWVGSDSATVTMPGVGTTCPILPVVDVRQVLQTLYVQPYRPGAQVLDYRDAPDVAALSPLRDSQVDSGTGLRSAQWVRAGEMRLGFNVAGADYEELVRGIVVYQSGEMTFGMGMPTIRTSGAAVDAMLALRAPAGQLDTQLADLVNRSITVVPAWERAFSDYLLSMQQIGLDGVRKRSGIITRANAEISAIINGGYAARSAVMDRVAADMGQAILGNSRYLDPASGQQAYLPHTYSSYWKAQDGTYIVSDEVNFDPNRDLGISARPLQAAQ